MRRPSTPEMKRCASAGVVRDDGPNSLCRGDDPVTALAPRPLPHVPTHLSNPHTTGTSFRPAREKICNDGSVQPEFRVWVRTQMGSRRNKTAQSSSAAPSRSILTVWKTATAGTASSDRGRGRDRPIRVSSDDQRLVVLVRNSFLNARPIVCRVRTGFGDP